MYKDSGTKCAQQLVASWRARYVRRMRKKYHKFIRSITNIAAISRYRNCIQIRSMRSVVCCCRRPEAALWVAHKTIFDAKNAKFTRPHTLTTHLPHLDLCVPCDMKGYSDNVLKSIRIIESSPAHASRRRTGMTK